MKTFKEFLKESYNPCFTLTEAQFTADKIAKVTSLYGKLFGKKFGGDFKVVYTEEFTTADGRKGMGYRMFNPQGYQLRFSFNKGNISAFNAKNTRDTFIVDAIDFWDKDNTELDVPSLSCTFSSSCNVVQIYKKLCDLLKRGKTGTFTLDNLITEAISSSGTIKQRRDFLKSHGMKIKPSYDGTFNDVISNAGLENEWEEFYVNIKRGKKETNTVVNNIEQTTKKFDETVYADPNIVFDDIRACTEFIAKGGAKSLIVCGAGGIGKTYEITSTLKKVLGEPGNKYTYHSGAKTSARAFYGYVFREREQLQVWDEADSILMNDDCIMMLKPALDTTGKNTMEYSVNTYPVNSMTEDEIRDYCMQCDMSENLAFSANARKVPEGTMIYPSKFYFDGSMIFISNMKASQIEDAIKSRSIFIDVYLCQRDIQNRINTVVHASYPDMQPEEIDAILEQLGQSVPEDNSPVVYMTPELARKRKPLTIRSAKLAIDLAKAGIPNWQRIAAMYV